MRPLRRVRGFADMTAEEVAELTGLSCDDAILSKQRDFDEPFVRAVFRAIAEAGIDYMEIGYKNSRKLFPGKKYKRN